MYSRNDDDWGWYSHAWKYNPDGKARGTKISDMVSLQINHSLGRSMFYELKLSYLDSDNGNYLYEDPLDSRYIHDQYMRSFGPGFNTGGQEKGHTLRQLTDLTGKFDFTWQVNKNHSLKTGVLAIQHEIDYQWHQIRNKYYADADVYYNYWDPELNTYIYPNYKPELFPDSTIYGEEYLVEPRELAVYIQDKMEFNEMVINLGVRYDYFDPNTTYPSNWRNPANQLRFENNPEKMSTDLQADPKTQISPRFGLSYQLSDQALLHFSYGHFFQAPPMYAFYQNHSYLVEPTDYATETGNPQLNAQKTVQYEIGLWQELVAAMGLEVNLFYRDIYDLLSMRVVSTYNQIQYGLYTNKDYGNVKGLEIKYDIAMNRLMANINYTLQYTRGNADDPLLMFTRAGDSMDPITRLIPMSWDQRHTLTATLSYSLGNYGATMTAYYNSGTPYTWSPISESRLSRVNLYPNNAWKPKNNQFDFYGFYDIPLQKNIKMRINLLVENLLDQRSELSVNGQTGHANEAIIREIDLAQHRSTFNEYEDRINNPASFSAPRYIKLGVGILF
ncbi:TonB-dependent receptor [candidate division KSB1 bacterium]|nr:TonB-dependent receptor [candidate division KSB1 bacterium]